MIFLEDVQKASRTIQGTSFRTPVMTSRTLDKRCGVEVFLKCENYQRTGSFKFRGAYNAVSSLGPEESSSGVTAHSSGNHAQALALAAAEKNIRARIVMPRGSSPVKIEAVRDYGAEVVLCDNSLESREKTTAELIAAEGLSLIHPYNDERVMAGAGTAALELLEETGKLDLILAPVGGGGLLSGTATAAKGLYPDIKVWGVEPAGADDAYRSFKDGQLVPQLAPQTIADGLRTSLGEKTFEVITERVDDIVLAEEEKIIQAMHFLWERMKIIVEPSGAVPLVPVLEKRLPDIEKMRIGVILSGGNINLNSFFDGLRNGLNKTRNNK